MGSQSSSSGEGTNLLPTFIARMAKCFTVKLFAGRWTGRKSSSADARRCFPADGHGTDLPSTTTVKRNRSKAIETACNG